MVKPDMWRYERHTFWLIALVVILVSFLFLLQQNAFAYNRSQVTRYAEKWCDGKNGFFNYYPQADCANFVSQCLIAGGLDLRGGPDCDAWNSIKTCDGLDDNLRNAQSATYSTILYNWSERSSSISTPHPYPNDWYDSWTITESGASKIRIHFSAFETEGDYDEVCIYNENYQEVACYSGDKGAFWTEEEIKGATVYISMSSDETLNYYGFDIDAYKYLPGPPSLWCYGDVLIYGDESGDKYKHAGIAISEWGNYVECAAHTTDQCQVDWDWAWGLSADEWKRANFYEIPSSQGWQPDLEPEAPFDWDQALVLSKESGNHKHDSVLPSNVPIYIDFCVENTGWNDVPDEVKATLYMDGNVIHTWTKPGMWQTINYPDDERSYFKVEDYEYTVTMEGYCTFIIVVDPDNYWDESDEWNNEFTTTVIFSGVDEELQDAGVPRVFSLAQNYPNPFNLATEIKYQLPKTERVEIGIFNLLGQKVRTLIDERKAPGYYKACWDGKDTSGEIVASGIYFYKIRAGEFTDIKKMVLLK